MDITTPTILLKRCQEKARQLGYTIRRRTVPAYRVKTDRPESDFFEFDLRAIAGAVGADLSELTLKWRTGPFSSKTEFACTERELFRECSRAAATRGWTLVRSRVSGHQLLANEGMPLHGFWALSLTHLADMLDVSLKGGSIGSAAPVGHLPSDPVEQSKYLHQQHLNAVQQHLARTPAPVKPTPPGPTEVLPRFVPK